VFKVSAFRLDTRAETGAPLSDCHMSKKTRWSSLSHAVTIRERSSSTSLIRFCTPSPALPSTTWNPPDLCRGCLVVRLWDRRRDEVQSVLCQQIKCFTSPANNNVTVTLGWQRRYTVKAVHVVDNSCSTSCSIISCLGPEIFVQINRMLTKFCPWNLGVPLIMTPCTNIPSTFTYVLSLTISYNTLSSLLLMFMVAVRCSWESWYCMTV